MKKFALDFEKPLIELEQRLLEMKEAAVANPDLAAEVEQLEARFFKLREKIYTSLTPWQKVQISRHPERPRTLDYIIRMTSDHIELHGDRLFRDDKAVVGGLAMFEGRKIVFLGHQKGKTAKENVERNFGSPHPEGIRKGIRIMEIAERFRLPLICFIDTAGAYPGIGAEERGQAIAIAESLLKMAGLKTKIVSIDIGEGGSGGALAFGIADRMLMLENAYFSVISPEGCASILWRDQAAKEKAAEALRLTAGDLKEFGIIDVIVDEPLGGAHFDPDMSCANLRTALRAVMDEIDPISLEQVIAERYERVRRIGSFKEKKIKSPDVAKDISGDK